MNSWCQHYTRDRSNLSKTELLLFTIIYKVQDITLEPRYFALNEAKYFSVILGSTFHGNGMLKVIGKKFNVPLQVQEKVYKVPLRFKKYGELNQNHVRHSLDRDVHFDFGSGD